MSENKSGTSLDEMLKTASQKLGTDPENLKKAAASGKIKDILKNIGNEKAKEVEKILSNKEAASKLLSTPKAQQLLKKLLGEK